MDFPPAWACYHPASVNRLIHGDNLETLRALASGSVDLAYLDPPFFTQRDHGAYDDRWPSMESYIAWLRERLTELRRLLKPTGSLYLHCDWHANAYIRVELDALFGWENFRNEIIWTYTGPSNTKRQFPRKHDTIFFYSAGPSWTFNPPRVPHTALHAGGIGNSVTSAEYRAQQLERGKIVEDWWSDISPVGRLARERVGYPTQKPLALLERIICASSNEGDVVLDPFCGSGTTLVAAQRLGRNWIGVDASHEAVELAASRLSVGFQRHLVPDLHV